MDFCYIINWDPGERTFLYEEEEAGNKDLYRQIKVTDAFKSTNC